MEMLNMLIGVLLNVLGFFLIKYYTLLLKEKRHSGLSINLMWGGIGAIIIGVSLIIRELL